MRADYASKTKSVFNWNYTKLIVRLNRPLRCIFCRLLEHNRVWQEAFLPPLYQDAEWGHKVDGSHTGSHRQQDPHRDPNSAAHQRHQGKTHKHTISPKHAPSMNWILTFVAVSSQENSVNPEIVEQMYRRNPILRYTQHPLHSPLLPLPYGEVTSRK